MRVLGGKRLDNFIEQTSPARDTAAKAFPKLDQWVVSRRWWKFEGGVISG
jgi:hypothetical protein